MSQYILDFLANFPKPLSVFIISMLPIMELRGGIPIGILVYHLNPVLVFLIAIIGNLVPPIFILFLLNKLRAYLSARSARLKYFFDWVYNRTYKKGGKTMEKWGAVALIAFVGIPLPMTGAYTGAVLALIFEIPFKKALALITIGVLISATIVTTLVLSGAMIF